MSFQALVFDADQVAFHHAQKIHHKSKLSDDVQNASSVVAHLIVLDTFKAFSNKLSLFTLKKSILFIKFFNSAF